MPTPENYQRAESLRKAVREEIEDLRSGRIARLSTFTELSARFNYTYPSSARTILIRSGLLNERKLAITESGNILPPERYQRAENLRNMVKQEIEDFKAGRRGRLSTSREISKELGYKTKGSVLGVLERAGLLNERKLAMSEIRYTFSPSSELAWILGVLAGGGSNNKRGVKLYSYDDDLRNQFKSRGERIFQIPAKEGTESITYGGKTVERPIVQFFNRKLSRALGDLRRDRYPDTVWGEHRWIWEQDKYGWSFLEGFFEVRGGIYDRQPHGYLLLLLITSSRKSVNFLTELMVKLGIENPTIRFTPSTKEGVGGVTLYRQSDIKKFAENVHPVNPEKSAKLAQIRDTELHDLRGRAILYTDEQVVEEWRKARDLLGHPPTVTDMKRLYKEGILPFTPIVFIRGFGAGSFRRARENLERIVEEQS